MHQDRLKTKSPNKRYDNGWDRIWGHVPTRPQKPTPLTRRRSEAVFKCCKCKKVFGTVRIAKGADPKGRPLICADCFISRAHGAASSNIEPHHDRHDPSIHDH